VYHHNISLETIFLIFLAYVLLIQLATVVCYVTTFCPTRSFTYDLKCVRNQLVACLFHLRYYWKDSANSISPRSWDQRAICLQPGESLYFAGLQLWLSQPSNVVILPD